MEKFDKFEQLDRKVESTIHEVENMDKRKIFKTSIFMAGIISLVLNLIIETLGRFPTQSIFGGVKFIFTNPIVFFYNAILLFAMLSLVSLMKRRAFGFTLVSMFWLIIGVANGVVLTQRMTPFTVNDLSVLGDGITLATNYMKTWQIVLAGVGIVLIIGLLVLLFIKGPKKENLKWKRNLVAVALIVATSFGSTSLLLSVHKIESFFGNLAYAYRDYGVVYCFINTWLNTGIDKPGKYNSERITGMFTEEELGKDKAILPEIRDEDDKHPNIIFLQLESFIDPTRVKYLKIKGDPCPTFRKLMKDYSSGLLTVPACGAGTANVEFEVMTGISVKFFGPGEYPYKSILTKTTCEGLPYDLRNIGYGTHAIHNHRAVFYNRNKVFSNMGFDTFTSVEYMNNVEKTPNNWAKDQVLIDCMLDALDSTKSRDMIYTISVQGHGKYPSEQKIKNPKITVESAPTEDLKWRWEYFANQVYEMDCFVRDFIKELKKRDEPTVLVMYGDHIPAIDMTEEDYENHNLYQTQYAIWDNIGLPRESEEMYAYRLSAHLMKRLGMHTGTVFTYQQNHGSSETFLEDLKALSYDILYGKKYIYGETKPYEPSKLKMGVKDIKVKKVVKVGDRYYIKGQNFTPYSKITLDGKTLNTIFLGQSVLGLLDDVDPAEAVNMKVSQIENKSKEILSTTE